MRHARHLADPLEGAFPAYHRIPRGTAIRRASNPVLRGVHPLDDFPTPRLDADYRPRPRSGVATTPPRIDLPQIFEKLKEEWLQDTADVSSTSDIVRHAAHLSIIGLGPAVLPLVLRETEQGRGHWFWALRAISRQDVAEDAETIDEATNAWLEWGRREGLI